MTTISLKGSLSAQSGLAHSNTLRKSSAGIPFVVNVNISFLPYQRTKKKGHTAPISTLPLPLPLLQRELQTVLRFLREPCFLPPPYGFRVKLTMDIVYRRLLDLSKRFDMEKYFSLVRVA